MAYFPFMIDIKDKKCLVVGGGLVAYRKVTDLLQFGAIVTVISVEICKEIAELQQVEIIKKAYAPEDLEDKFLVIAATDLEDVNRAISKDCEKRQIFVNAVDLKDACSFIFPAMIKKDNLVVSISTGGNSPAGAVYLKEKVEKCIPEQYEKNLEFLGSIRSKVMENITDINERKKMYYELLKKADAENRVLREEDFEEYIEQLIEEK